MKSLPKGFTLIELLIVITIIGILAVALVPRISQGPARARDVARKAHLSDISTALQLYFADNAAYPSPTTGTTECINTTGMAVNTAITPLMKSGAVPADPISNGVMPCVGSGYAYRLFSPTSYAIAALLESDTVTGDGLYCKFPPTDTTYATSLSSLVPCDSSYNGTPHWYVISQ